MNSNDKPKKITLESILEEFRELAQSNQQLGSAFEKLVVAFLRADPIYKNRFSKVWLWGEWPSRWSSDVGIDIVAKETLTGGYCAIQCKFYLPEHTISKDDINSFFATSGKYIDTADGKKSFTSRIIVSTTDKWSRHAEGTLENQEIPCSRIQLQNLRESSIDWKSFREGVIKTETRTKKELYDYQVSALEKTRSGFKDHNRGKLIMACGTGKTFTALKIMEDQTPEHGLILFLVPSISLLSQTLREWAAEASLPFHGFAVCSDSKIGKEQEDLSAHDLAYPATTDYKKLALHAKKAVTDRRTIIFSTYQSIDVIADAQKHSDLSEFDLIICDEAHRTTGITRDGDDASNFTKVHDNDAIRASKRLYMTATPRIYTEASKNKAVDKKALLSSMDDPKLYGPEFYRIGFSDSVERGILSDYKVLIVAVDEDAMAHVANQMNTEDGFQIDDKLVIDTKLAVRIIGAWKGLAKHQLKVVNTEGETGPLTEDTAPMRRSVAFSRTIKASKAITEIFSKIVEVYSKQHEADNNRMIRCDLTHVDGTMNALKRSSSLNWLRGGGKNEECRILSNARCLSEGVDVPTLDSVIFFDTRESIVDIVQSVGRIMRKAKGKQYGYIILPVGIPTKKISDYNSYIEKDDQFKSIWKIIKALRAHDESLVDEAEFRRKIKIVTAPTGTESNDSDAEGDRGEQADLDFPPLVDKLDQISDAVYTAIPARLGDREYWSDWAKDIGNIAEHLIMRIKALADNNDRVANDFKTFVKGLRNNLNPSITEDDCIEMLAQHTLTLPVFEALFAGGQFPNNNPVAKALEVMVQKLDTAAIANETEGLKEFYENVRKRIKLAKSDKSKQEVIRNLYDTFFHNAFPRMAERLGIVYTPVEVVDFILKSSQYALQKHFGKSIGDSDIQILDPFSGTGTFLVRLIQSELISKEHLPLKFEKELHANEIVLLAYYIATVNIETAFHARTGKYKPFDGMVLNDTFQMTENADIVDKLVLPENNERAVKQRAQPIRVIIGNPPYSARQGSENDNNKNIAYPKLDGHIRESYAKLSSAQSLKNAYDSYIRAIRWASDRIDKKGVIAFVTNGSFLEANNMDGLRKSLAEDFSHLYILNMRGNARTSGEERRKEGGHVFGEGSRTTIAITIMVKDPTHSGPCELQYHDIGNYLSRKDKLEELNRFGNIGSILWTNLNPNDEGDWINQRNPEFKQFLPIGNKKDKSATLFSVFSMGLFTSRDAWAYSYSKSGVKKQIQHHIRKYNDELTRYQEVPNAIRDEGRKSNKFVSDFVDPDPKKISWSRALKNDLKKGKRLDYDYNSLVEAAYRPFSSQWCYFNRRLNECVYQMPRIFPTSNHQNLVISSAGRGANSSYSALVSSKIPDLGFISNVQCFPLYWYEKVSPEVDGVLNLVNGSAATPDEYGYVRHDAVTDWALSRFQTEYSNTNITKEDIFWYIYGILHSPDYKDRFASDLKKMLPHIPLADDFWVFANAGCKLGQLHLNYESVEPWPVTEVKMGMTDENSDWYVEKMRFGRLSGREKDKSIIHYNARLTLKDIPLEAYDYIVNSKSAIEWIMDRYAVSINKDSGIQNDPNDWCTENEDTQYIVKILKRMIRVSMETMEIVNSLPPIKERSSTS